MIGTEILAISVLLQEVMMSRNPEPISKGGAALFVCQATSSCGTQWPRLRAARVTIMITL